MSGTPATKSEAQRVYKLAGTTFKVDRRYRDLKAVGRGSYGIVASATDAEAGNRRVAIKKITPMAAHIADAKHVLREVRLMRYLSAHPNIISMYDLAADSAHDEMYIIMELLDSDLHRIIQSPQPLTDAHTRYFMHQLLRGISYLHDHGIIHRDLKPGNLLVTRNCDLRITDFGLAREHPKGAASANSRQGGLRPEGDEEERMTQHVVTRWYRPPELMLCPDGLYSFEVDMWSAGCILSELLGRKPLFPGKNFVHQLTLIFDVLGAPPPSAVQHITNAQAVKFLQSMRGKPAVPFKALHPSASGLPVDLLASLLPFEPEKRASASAALDHPYFAPFAGTVPPAPPIHPSFNFNFEGDSSLSRQRLRGMVLDEVASFRNEVRGLAAPLPQQQPQQGSRVSSGTASRDVSQGASTTTTARSASGIGAASGRRASSSTATRSEASSMAATATATAGASDRGQSSLQAAATARLSQSTKPKVPRFLPAKTATGARAKDGVSGRSLGVAGKATGVSSKAAANASSGHAGAGGATAASAAATGRPAARTAGGAAGTERRCVAAAAPADVMPDVSERPRGGPAAAAAAWRAYTPSPRSQDQAPEVFGNDAESSMPCPPASTTTAVAAAVARPNMSNAAPSPPPPRSPERGRQASPAAAAAAAAVVSPSRAAATANAPSSKSNESPYEAQWRWREVERQRLAHDAEKQAIQQREAQRRAEASAEAALRAEAEASLLRAQAATQAQGAALRAQAEQQAAQRKRREAQAVEAAALAAATAKEREEEAAAKEAAAAREQRARDVLVQQRESEAKAAAAAAAEEEAAAGELRKIEQQRRLQERQAKIEADDEEKDSGDGRRHEPRSATLSGLAGSARMREAPRRSEGKDDDDDNDDDYFLSDRYSSPDRHRQSSGPGDGSRPTSVRPATAHATGDGGAAAAPNGRLATARADVEAMDHLRRQRVASYSQQPSQQQQQQQGSLPRYASATRQYAAYQRDKSSSAAHLPPQRHAATTTMGPSATATAGNRVNGESGPELNLRVGPAAGERKKRLTVPKSPNFSKFSWQQSSNGPGGRQADSQPAAAANARSRRAPFGGGPAQTRRF